ncbi:17699_t:CDS:2, partial [Racocetra fulgida]
YFKRGDLINSKHFQAICSYYRDPILEVPERMLNYLKESCKKIRKKVQDTLDNININKKKHAKNKRAPVNITSDEEGNITDSNQTSPLNNNQTSSLNNNQLIHQQLLIALIFANVPFTFVENEEVKKLFKMLQPSYTLPSRRWISTEILDNVHNEVEIEIQKFIDDSKFLTLSGDGWTNVSKCSLVNFIFTNEKWQTKARRMIDNDSELQGKIITIPCIAHQTNLLVKKIIKSEQFESVISKMLLIINHFRNSNRALAKLRKLEKNENLTPKYPCITRWATFSKTTETLLSTRSSMRIIAITDSDLLAIKGNNRNKIINTIEDTSFWTKLDKFFHILKPYDYIVKILESDKVTLGHISVCWAWLRNIIDELPDDSSFLDFKDLMLDEIDNRWKKIYNPIFVITWFLHPYYYGKGIREERLLQLQEDAYSLF